MAEFIHGVVCGHCGRMTEMHVTTVTGAPRRAIIRDGRTEPVHAMRAPAADGARHASATGFCSWCAEPTLLTYLTINGAAGPQLRDLRQFPPPHPLDAPTVWPADLAEAWSNTLRAVAGGVSGAGILSLAGTCLQQALRHLGARGDRLAAEIADLRSRNIISGGLADWADDLRQRRNGATHDMIAAPEDADEAVEMMKVFLYLTFTLPATIAARRAPAP